MGASDTLIIGSAFDPLGMDRGLNEAAAKLQRFAKTAAQSISFKSVGGDVDRATADFKAGVITLDDYSNALAHAKQEFHDLRAKGLEPSRASLLQIDTALGRSTGNAGNLGTGIARLRSGMAQLAVSSLGASNALGQVAQGALFLAGGGSGTIVKIALGIAAVGFASQKLGEAQAEATKHAEGLAKALKEQAATGTPFLKVTADVKALQTEMNILTAKVQSQRRLWGDFGFSIFGPLGAIGVAGFKAAAGVVAVAKALALAQKALDDLKVQPLQDFARELAVLNIGEESVKRLELVQQELSGAVAKGTVAMFDQVVALKAEQKAAEDAAKALEEMLKVQHATRVANAGGGNLTQGAGGTNRGPLTGGLLSGASADQITDSRGAAWEAAKQAAKDYFGAVREGIDSLLTVEQIHLDFINAQRDAYNQVADAAFGLARAANDIGLIGTNAANAIGSVLDLAGAIQEIERTGDGLGNILNLASAGLGAIGGLIGSLPGVGGPTKTEQLMAENNQRLADLRASLDKNIDTLAGLTASAEQLGILRDVATLPFGGKGGRGTRPNPEGIDQALAAAGMSLEEWAARVERQTGIDVLDDKGRLVAATLGQVDLAFKLLIEDAERFAADEAARQAAEDLAEASRKAEEQMGRLAEAAGRAAQAVADHVEQIFQQYKSMLPGLLGIRSQLMGTSEDPNQQFLNALQPLLDATGGTSNLATQFQGQDLNDPEVRERLREQFLDYVNQILSGQIQMDDPDIAVAELMEFLGQGADILDSFNESVLDATKSLTNMPHGINLAAYEFQAQAAGGFSVASAPAAPFMPAGPRAGELGGSQPFRGTDGVSAPVVVTQPVLHWDGDIVVQGAGKNAEEIAREVKAVLKRQSMTRFGTPDKSGQL